MNNRQKIVQEQFINNEEAVIKRLKSVYKQSLKDIEGKTLELQNAINSLDLAISVTEDAEELARLQSMKQSKVYQKQYQDALKKQVGSILDNMQVEEFKTVSEYLQKCYEDGFIGTMFDLQGQGIPLCFPLDQEAMVRAVQLDSKISQGLYSRLGEDVSLLKKKITAQVSRGISTGMSYSQVAQQLAGYTNIGFNNAVRIARTEGHRIQTQGAMDACYKAKDRGADIVKQWDAALDARTRDSHARVDGEIRELDKKFSNGLMFPGDPSGGAAEVVNCRCALLQRARWALDEAELETLKERAEYFGLDKAEEFEDYKQKYLKAAETVKAQEVAKTAKTIQSVSLGSKEVKTFEELSEYMASTYGVTISNKVQSLDFETVKDALSGIEWAMQQFPKTQGYLKKIDVKKGGVMQCVGDKIYCSPATFSGNYYKGNHGFFRSTGVHEAAHMAEGCLINSVANGRNEFAELWNSRSLAREIAKEAVSKLPDDITRNKSIREIYETISPDASINPSECIAEAVADVYRNGEGASSLSIEIFRIMKAKLK